MAYVDGYLFLIMDIWRDHKPVCQISGLYEPRLFQSKTSLLA